MLTLGPSCRPYRDHTAARSKASNPRGRGGSILQTRSVRHQCWLQTTSTWAAAVPVIVDEAFGCRQASTNRSPWPNPSLLLVRDYFAIRWQHERLPSYLRVVGVVELLQHESVLADFRHDRLRLRQDSFEALARRRQHQLGAESLPTNISFRLSKTLMLLLILLSILVLS